MFISLMNIICHFQNNRDVTPELCGAGKNEVLKHGRIKKVGEGMGNAPYMNLQYLVWGMFYSIRTYLFPSSFYFHHELPWALVVWHACDFSFLQ